MRTWLALALILAAFAGGCATPRAQSAFGPPPRDELLQPLASDSDVVDGVRINANTWLKSYPVSAEGGLASIRRQLDRLGPTSDVTGQRFDGLTTWALRWGFNYDETSGSCKVRNATIEVEAVVTLPELQGPDALPPGELALWQDYAGKLRSHEDGHVNIYLTAARQLREQIFQTQPMPDCRSLAAVLNQKGNAMIETIRYTDRLYDAATGHGAVFP
jgi:predicted secreted Zn-dependent protease